jgi:hypothetical protein
VILTVLVALEKGEYHSEKSFELMVDLARRLLGKGFSKFKIKKLLDFLSTYVYFGDKEMYANFEREIDTLINKEKSMGITELSTMLIEEHGREMGREEGKVEGMEKGMEKAKSSMVSNLLLKTNYSLQEIADFADASVDFVIGVKNKLSAAAN